MREHPALAVKYLLPQYTRGAGIEVGAGITAETTPLYPHFKKTEQLEGMTFESLDFVVACEADPTAFLDLPKRGGHLVLVADSSYEDACAPFESHGEDWDMVVFEHTKPRSLFIFKKL